MDRQILNFTANEQILTVDEPIRISTNKVNYIEAHFDLGQNWSGYDSVRAVWYNDFYCISTVLDSQGVCFVPSEVMKRNGKVKVNLVGSISENDVLTDRLTSYPVVAVIVDCTAQINGAETSPITPSQFEQYVAIVRNLVESVKDIDHIELNSDYTLTIYYSDGTSYTTSSIRGATGNGIASIAKTGSSGSNPVIDTYTVTYTDGNTFTFTVTNGIKGDTGETGATGATGNGIASIAKVGTVGLVDTYRITMTDSSTYDFTVTNGQDGEVTQAQLNDVKNALSYNGGYTIKQSDVSYGEWTNGELVASGYTRQSYNKYPLVISGSKITYNTGAVLGICIIVYADDNTTILQIVDWDTTETDKTVTITQTGHLSIKFRREGGSYMSADYYTTSGATVTIYNSIGFKVDNTIEKVNAIIPKVDTFETTISTPVFTYIDNSYINYQGEITSNNSFKRTSPIFLRKGVVLHVYAKGYNTTVAICSQTNKDNTDHTPVLICPDSNAAWFKILIPQNGYYALSTSKAITMQVYLIDAYQEPTEDVNLSMFLKFGVIGDSYASGVIYKTWGQSDQHYENSWGQIMARYLGTTCTNYSSGGLSTRTWLTHSAGLSKLLANDPEDIYYCALGINDYSQLGHDYLGSISDINDEDYTLNADTFYGNYGKIISNIKAHAPNALIVMFTCANTANSVAVEFTDAIMEIANHFEIPYIVEADDPFFQSPIYTDMLGGHPTSIGYGGMANAFIRLIQGSIQRYPGYYQKAYREITP